LVYIYLYLAGSWAAVPWTACTNNTALKRISPGAKASSCQAVQHYTTEPKQLKSPYICVYESVKVAYENIGLKVYPQK